MTCEFLCVGWLLVGVLAADVESWALAWHRCVFFVIGRLFVLCPARRRPVRPVPFLPDRNLPTFRSIGGAAAACRRRRWQRRRGDNGMSHTYSRRGGPGWISDADGDMQPE